MADLEVDDNGDGGGVSNYDGAIKVEEVELDDENEVQPMDHISCIIDEDDSDCGGDGRRRPESESSRSLTMGNTPTIQKLLKRMRRLEEQVAACACVEGQPLLRQVFKKCNLLEQRLKVMKKNVDHVSERLEQFDKAFAVFTTLAQSRTHEKKMSTVGVKLRSSKTSTPICTNQQHIDYANDAHDHEEGCDDEIFEESHTEQIEFGDEPDNYSVVSPLDQQEILSPASVVANIGDVEQQPGMCTRRTSAAAASVTEKALKDYSCKICKLSCRNHQDLTNHYTSQHPVPVPDLNSNTATGRVTRSSNLSKHKPKPKQGSTPTSNMTKQLNSTNHRTHKCKYCTQTFRLKKDAISHQSEVHGAGPQPGSENGRVVCSECGLSVSVKCFKSHLKTHTQERQRHHCETCGSSFLHLGDLKVHRLKHTGERPFACPHCDKRFNMKSSLRGHVQLHTGKAHVCEKCGWSFAKRNYLKKHMLNHEKGKTRTQHWEKTRPGQRADAGAERTPPVPVTPGLGREGS